MDFKTLVDAILDSQLPRCRTRSTESMLLFRIELFNPLRFSVLLRTKSNALTTCSRNSRLRSTPPSTLSRKPTSKGTRPSLLARKSRLSSESCAKRTIFLSESNRFSPRDSRSVRAARRWSRERADSVVVVVVAAAGESGESTRWRTESDQIWMSLCKVRLGTNSLV